MIASEQTSYTTTSLQDDYKWIISCNWKYPVAQAQIWRKNRASLISVSQIDFFYLQ